MARILLGVTGGIAAYKSLELVGGPFAVVVDDAVVELVLGGEFLGGDGEAGFDRLRRIGAAGLEAAAQSEGLGRCDEDLDGLRHRRPDLACALHLDLEDDGTARVEAALDLGAQRSVAVAAVGGELEEVLGVDPLIELGAVEEVVVAAVLLALAGVPRGCRDRHLELRDAPQQLADQRPLPDP